VSNYWAALARGANFEDLKAKGFQIFYPVMDDYVFLEACDKNKYLLSKQEELRVKFLRDNTRKQLLLITQVEIDRMISVTQDDLVEGQDISVVEGYCAGLDGKIISRSGSTFQCDVFGYRKVFRVQLPINHIVKRDVAVSVDKPLDLGYEDE